MRQRRYLDSFPLVAGLLGKGCAVQLSDEQVKIWVRQQQRKAGPLPSEERRRALRRFGYIVE
jgi:hypothetical protein